MKKLVAPGSAILVAILSIFALDQRLCSLFDEPALKPIHDFAVFITDIGKAEHWLIMAVVIYIMTSFKLKTAQGKPALTAYYRNLQHWSAHLLVALAVSGFFLHLIKVLFGRQRPYMTLDHQAQIFHPFTMNWDFGSFPSGHTQTLFSVGYMLTILWPKNTKTIWLFAAVLSLTRVMAIQHFLSDVIGGGLLGIYASQFSQKLLSRKIPKPLPLNLKN